MSTTSLEIKQERELALHKDEESAQDDEILDVGAFLVRSQAVKHSAGIGPATISQTHNTSSAPQVPFVQVESDVSVSISYL
jgi:hypothetical protein